MSGKNKFVTVSKKESFFSDYLTGRFSSSQRAVPIHNFSVNTENEKITFELKKIELIKKPNIFYQLLALSRPLYWTFTLGPLAIVVGLNLLFQWPINTLNLVLSFISLILLNLAAFALNDYYDHLSGVDRISDTSGSQVIQKAWLTAQQVKYIAYFCLSLTLVVSFPILKAQPQITIGLACFVALALFGFSYKDIGLKYKGFGEFIVFMALGPLVVIGLSVAISGKLRIEHFGIGACLGWMAMIHMQIKNWMHIMADSQAGVKTFISRLGFDRSKIYLCFQIFVLFLLSLGVFTLPVPTVMSLLFCAFIAFSGGFIAYKIIQVKSPVSSKLKKIYNYTMVLNWIYCLTFAGMLFFAS